MNTCKLQTLHIQTRVSFITVPWVLASSSLSSYSPPPYVGVLHGACLNTDHLHFTQMKDNHNVLTLCVSDCLYVFYYNNSNQGTESKYTLGREGRKLCVTNVIKHGCTTDGPLLKVNGESTSRQV